MSNTLRVGDFVFYTPGIPDYTGLILEIEHDLINCATCLMHSEGEDSSIEYIPIEYLQKYDKTQVS